MAKPAREMSWPEKSEPELQDEEEGEVMLQRWVERPGGGFELLEMPLTLELYLNPRLGDKSTQGELHADLMAELKELLGRHFRHQRDVKVLMDVKHQFSPRRGPSPDISIIRGVRNPDLKSSFNVVKEGSFPPSSLRFSRHSTPGFARWTRWTRSNSTSESASPSRRPKSERPAKRGERPGKRRPARRLKNELRAPRLRARRLKRSSPGCGRRSSNSSRPDTEGVRNRAGR
jgi:hypothetical protein